MTFVTTEVEEFEAQVEHDKDDFVVLDADADYGAQRSNPITYDVDFSVVVTAPYNTKVLKVWLPIPQSDFGQHFHGAASSGFRRSDAMRGHDFRDLISHGHQRVQRAPGAAPSKTRRCVR